MFGRKGNMITQEQRERLLAMSEHEQTIRRLISHAETLIYNLAQGDLEIAELASHDLWQDLRKANGR